MELHNSLPAAQEDVNNSHELNNWLVLKPPGGLLSFRGGGGERDCSVIVRSIYSP